MIHTNWLNIILLLGSVQGFFMTYLLWQKKWTNTAAVQHLVYLVVLVSCLMLGRIAISVPALSDWGALILLPDVILFLIGPLSYFFIRSLLQKDLPPKPQIYWHFLPALIHVFILNTLVAMHLEDFWNVMNQQQVIYLFFFIEGAAIVSMLTYLSWSIYYFQNYKAAFHEKYSAPFLGDFLRFFSFGAALLFVFWTMGYLRNFFLATPDYSTYILAWFILVVMTYVLAAKILISPKLLQLPPLKEPIIATLPSVVQPSSRSIETASIESPISTTELTNVSQFMTRQKPFLNPELKIGDLAKLLDMPQYELSKIINRGFEKNFFDFINEYRVHEFIRLKQDAKFAQFNNLKLAFQSGFNSKSAFNRAFRKVTGDSPRSYFKKI